MRGQGNDPKIFMYFPETGEITKQKNDQNYKQKTISLIRIQ